MGRAASRLCGKASNLCANPTFRRGTPLASHRCMSEAAAPSRARAARRAAPAKTSSRGAAKPTTAKPALTISSKNYSSWSLRGWLLARFVELDFDEIMVSPDDADARKEVLLLAPSIRVF